MEKRQHDASTMMSMEFVNIQTTPLYAAGWTPSSTGGYAGTCIFLNILAILFRSLFAAKHILEARWADQAHQRRFIVVADKQPVSEQYRDDLDSKTGVLTANGVEENVKVVHKPTHAVQPWRASVDVPRAGLVTIISGVGYLLYVLRQ
jgi:hypothetical protein